MTTRQFDRDLEDPIDTIDAAMFSGDMFIDESNREQLRYYLARWERELKNWDQMDEEIEDETE